MNNLKHRWQDIHGLKRPGEAEESGADGVEVLGRAAAGGHGQCSCLQLLFKLASG